MALSQKVKDWYEKEYGIPISEASDICACSSHFRLQKDIDSENERLVELLAKPTIPPKRSYK